MTNEEAFKLAMQACKKTWNEKTCKQIKEALEQEPCDDTVSIRKDVLKCRVGKLVVYNVEWLKKHWQMEMDIVCGVKPCDDAISREWLMRKATERFYTTNYFNHISAMIEEAPSVTQKYGKWILLDECANSGYYCSNCQKKLVKEGWSQTVKKIKYCPNCGAKMESEDKE